MKGKQRCKILKEIRQRIADANDVAYITSECQHKGDCLGTCPKCEAELRYLERELEKRQRLGKTVVVAGLSALIATSTVGCDDWFGSRELGGEPLPDPNYQEQELDGDVALPPEPVELGGDIPLPHEGIDYASDEVAELSPDELTEILTNGVTFDGLYNSQDWADLYIQSGKNSDTYRSPIDAFDTMTVFYDESGYIFKVEFADTQPDGGTPVVLPEDSFS